MLIDDILADVFQVALEVQITVAEEPRITWMIVVRMKLFEILVSQVSDVCRLAAGVETILALLEEISVDVLHKRLLRAGHRALHLIKHHTLEGKLATRVIPLLELKPMPLLLKVFQLQCGIERHVTVDSQQVSIILHIRRAEGIHREVGTSPRIHVRVETTLHHVKEWITHGVHLRAASRQVL